MKHNNCAHKEPQSKNPLQELPFEPRSCWPINPVSDLHPVANVLPLDHVADLLSHCSADPLPTLHVVLPLFTGIHTLAIPGLKWEHFGCGTHISLPGFDPAYRHAAVAACQPRRLPTSPAFHQWLQPFRNASEALFADPDLHQTARYLMSDVDVCRYERLRMTCLAHTRALNRKLSPQGAYYYADELEVLNRRPCSAFDADLARLFFSIPPELLGINDWPDRVAAALKQYFAQF